jgi:hypothetical protein
MNILNDIYNSFGDLLVNIHYDPRQSESLIKDPQGINIDEIKTIQISEDGTSVNIMNKYSWINDYNGCRGEVYYNPDTKQYEGRIIPTDYIEGFNTTFTSPDKYQIEPIFKYAVDEYNDFMGNAKIIRTMEAVNGIVGEGSQDQDLDYGELQDTPKDDSYESSDDDEDYGEI